MKDLIARVVREIVITTRVGVIAATAVVPLIACAPPQFSGGRFEAPPANAREVAVVIDADKSGTELIRIDKIVHRIREIENSNHHWETFEWDDVIISRACDLPCRATLREGSFVVESEHPRERAPSSYFSISATTGKQQHLRVHVEDGLNGELAFSFGIVGPLLFACGGIALGAGLLEPTEPGFTEKQRTNALVAGPIAMGAGIALLALALRFNARRGVTSVFNESGQKIAGRSPSPAALVSF